MLIRARQGLRRRRSRRRWCASPRHDHRAGSPTPARSRAWRRTSISSAACAPASSRTAPRAARQDRPGGHQHAAARSRSVPHPSRPSLPPGRRLVHLPDVRLRPLPGRRHRGRHPLVLHAGIRQQPRALRLGDRRDPRRAALRRPAGAPADRVRPTQSGLHRHVEAQAEATGAGWPRRRLGRPAHADAVGLPPPRLHARVDPRLLPSASASPRPTT